MVEMGHEHDIFVGQRRIGAGQNGEDVGALHAADVAPAFHAQGRLQREAARFRAVAGGLVEHCGDRAAGVGEQGFGGRHAERAGDTNPRCALEGAAVRLHP